jgi:hypothetical protein
MSPCVPAAAPPPAPYGRGSAPSSSGSIAWDVVVALTIVGALFGCILWRFLKDFILP